MRFELLGPVRMVDDHGDWREIRGTMPRTVLAVLLLNADTVVPADELIEIVWGGSAPASAQESLHNHLMRLRRMLGDEGGARIRAAAASPDSRRRPGPRGPGPCRRGRPADPEERQRRIAFPASP